MSDEPVLLEIEDDIATITLNEPDRYNPWSIPIIEGLQDALDEARAARPRCLVIQGAGDAFSSGGDIDRMQHQIEEEPAWQRTRVIEEETMGSINKVVRFPAPVIAKIDGPAAGVGANLAIACDILLASERSIICFAFANVGVSVDGGGTGLLPKIVGLNIAKELVFKGEIVEADRAKNLGIFNHVYTDEEFEERVQEEIEEIASGPTLAQKTAKRLLDEGVAKSIEQTLIDEAYYAAGPCSSRDHKEGVDAFLENRDPEFEGR
jgi:enoyl-CoA hydratase/carnithine racemase